jgi:predicted 2-oxoglutarate/Fe(II)-dependent dioxygenase YbiX
VVGLNERLRFLRYSPGDYFILHFDGCFRRQDEERSFITLQLYLNEGFDGGDTTFIDIDTDATIGVKPKTGNVFIFQHDIYHSGAEVTQGHKYAVRTEVMFQRQRAAP